MKNDIDKAREIVDSLFFEDKALTQWQWELLLGVINDIKAVSCPLVDKCSIKSLYEKELEKSKSSAKKKPYTKKTNTDDDTTRLVCRS